MGGELQRAGRVIPSLVAPLVARTRERIRPIVLKAPPVPLLPKPEPEQRYAISLLPNTRVRTNRFNDFVQRTQPPTRWPRSKSARYVSSSRNSRQRQFGPAG